MNWRLVNTRQARMDSKEPDASGRKDKAQALLDVVAEDPIRSQPPCEKIAGDLAGAHSRRINIQHRLVYQVLEDERVVKVIRLWSRCG